MLNDRPEDNQRMRLCSYRDGRVGERLAVIDGDLALPAGDLLPDGPRTMAELIARGDRALAALRAVTDPERVRRDRELAAVGSNQGSGVASHSADNMHDLLHVCGTVALYACEHA